MLNYKGKKNQIAKGNRMLISITVIGSAGPIRFIVHETDLVSNVIDMALKSYSREGRLPLLTPDVNNFLLYCPHSGSNALNSWESIGVQGARNFMLCKKPQPDKLATTDDGRSNCGVARASKGSGKWKSWINKSLNLNLSSRNLPIDC